MAQTKTFYRSFAGGEISPEMFGRIDDAKFQSGVGRLRNFITKPQGPAVRRPGTEFVRAAKYADKKCRLIPFIYNDDQTLRLELGDSYIRFHTDGGTLLPGSPGAFIPSSPPLTFNTGTDVITWTAHGLVDGDTVAFTTTGVLPGIVADQVYYVLAIDADTFSIEESLGSGVFDLTGVPSGTNTGYRHYLAGTLVSYLGDNYMCVADHHAFLPTNISYWYEQPATGELEIPSPWVESELFDITYAQSNDVMTLTVVGKPIRELRRLSATGWVLGTVTLAPTIPTVSFTSLTPSLGQSTAINAVTIASPAVITTAIAHGLSVGDPVYIGGLNVSLTGLVDDFYVVNTTPSATTLTVRGYSGGAVINSGGTYTAASDYIQFATRTVDNVNYYKATAVADDGTESAPSDEESVTNNLFVTGAYNTLLLTAAEGAVRYRFYKKQNGLFGYIGQSDTITFVDDNIAPDMGQTPPIRDTSELFLPDNYPSCVSYFEQRRAFAGTSTEPQTLWLTKSGSYDDMSYSIPTVDTDRIKVKVAAQTANTIRHIVPMSELVLLTGGGEWRVSAINSEALTPSTISIRPQSFVGASHVQPQIVNNALVFCAARGGHVREMAFNWQSQGFLTGDLSLRAAHLFDNYEIVDMAYSKAPFPILWFTSSNGQLLSMTYVPEEQIGGWAWHDTDGLFESVCSAPEGEEDRPYFAVQRTIDGGVVRYIERMSAFEFADLEDGFFVDCGLTYSGAATDTITGLDHLEGETVSILANGKVHAARTVVGGEITLDGDYTLVHIGLPYNSDLQTLPMSIQMEGFAQGRNLNVNAAWVRFYRTAGGQIGPDEDKLVPVSPYDTAPTLRSEILDVALSKKWQIGGQVWIRQSDPLPMTVVAVTAEVAIGG